MDTNNPAEMSNTDLEKAMENNKPAQGTTNDPMIAPAEEVSSAIDKHTAYHEESSQDLDDLVHQRAREDSQDGSMPDPETLKGL